MLRRASAAVPSIAWVILAACGGSRAHGREASAVPEVPTSETRGVAPPPVEDAAVTAPAPARGWAGASSSPRAVALEGLATLERELLEACGAPEEGLMNVAEGLAERKAKNLPYLELDGLVFAQRRAGEPHVWPRAWIVSAASLERAGTLERLVAWKKSFGDPGERRCGLATRRTEAGVIVAAIAIDAIADLKPLPTRGRTGQWLELDANARVPATGARVVLMGPSGAPRSVPTSRQGDRIRARFVLDRPGGFTVQLLLDVATGPRPALEAHVYADVEPPASASSEKVPGEDAGGTRTGTEALVAMVSGVRALEGLAPLTHDARLDALALEHARRMKAAHTVGHDVGDGDPAERLQNAGLSAREAGENVAHAETVRLAHRALWASPSHRANLLRASFSHVGIAVLDDPDGSIWACEVFATQLGR